MNAITANGESVTLNAIGASALSSVGVSTISFTNCTPASISTTSTNYYDTNYVPLGSNESGGSYTVWLTPPSIPSTATVGTTAIIGTETYYTNSTKSTPDGRRDVSMVVEPDTASTAIVNAISKRYNQSGQLLYTSQSRRRIDASGTTTPLSSDIQYATTSTLRLVFRR